MNKQTAVYDVHKSLSGRMVAYANWDMPLDYGSIVREHEAVRQDAGIFDVSHMGELAFRGDDAHRAVDYLISNILPEYSARRAVYGGLLNEAGGFVDDMIALMVEPAYAVMIVNAANTEKDEAWVRHQLKRVGERFPNVTMTNESAKWGLLAIQGPKALSELEKVIENFQSGAPFSIQKNKFAGVEVIVMMTGYTGESGVEILVPWEKTSTLFCAFVDAGVSPCGLGARDSLRLEKGYSLYGNELDERSHAWEAGLGWTVKMSKADFIGKAALLRIASSGEQKRRMLKGLLPEGTAPVRAGALIFSRADEQQKLGHVTSGMWSISLKRPIALGYISGEYTGEEVLISLRGRMLSAKVTKRSFL